MNISPSSSELAQQIESLQTDLANLHDEYQATLRQFDCNLNDTDRVKLETRLAEIDRQMSDIEREIRSIA
jgi:predicted  nucleic acid-binding Zn-ribbon protein